MFLQPIALNALTGSSQWTSSFPQISKKQDQLLPQECET